MIPVRARLALLALTPVLFTASPVDGQLLRGRAVDAVSDQPLSDVGILVHMDSVLHRVLVTDSAGRFEIVLPRAGPYTITASREGYWTVGPASFEAPVGRVLEITLRLSSGPVALDAIEVRARRLPPSALDAARVRSSENRRLGVGLHLDRDEIDDRFAYTASDLVRSMSMQIGTTMATAAGSEASIYARRMGARCPLSLFLDGVYVHPAGGGIDDLITPDLIEAVEVYFGSQVRAGFHDPSGCGLVLVWSRRDAPGYRFTWIGSAVITAVLGIFWLAR